MGSEQSPKPKKKSLLKEPESKLLYIMTYIMPVIASIYVIGKIFGIGEPMLIIPLSFMALVAAGSIFTVIIQSDSTKDIFLNIASGIIIELLMTLLCLLMLAIFGFLLVSFIIDSMLILLGGGAKAFGESLSDEAQRSSSSGDSDSGYDRWGYDENGSAHKLENIGGGYARDSDGRRWKNDGGSKYHLDE